MATFEAIRGVSHTLRALLRDRMELPDGVGSCPITVGPPRSNVPQPLEAAEALRVNLFLYRTQHNAALRNQELPGRGHPGGRGVPPLSLDLFYLVTAFGTMDDDGHLGETIAHALLGSAMRVLHDHPVVTDGLTTVRPPVGEPILHPSIRGEVERVKITPEPLTLEDLSKIWTALTLPFRVGAAYQVSVVQIESRRPGRSAPPVLEPPPGGARVTAAPLPRPAIRALTVRRPGDPAGSARGTPFARAGDTLVIEGEQLAGEAVAVRVGGSEFALGATTNPGRVEFVFNPGADLAPGPHPVEVLRRLAGTGAVVRSNQAVLMLVPRVDAVTVAGPRRVTITGDRLFAEGRPGQASFGAVDVPDSAYLSAAPGSLTVPLPDALPAGNVPVLVSVPPNLTPPAGPWAVTVTGGAVTRPVGFGTASGPADAAVVLQNRVRGAGQAGAPAAAVVRPLAGCRVAATADGRLVVVAGGLAEALTFGGADAGRLGLTPAAGAKTRGALLSGVCDPFPVVTAAAPAVAVTIGGAGAVPRRVALAARPTTLAGFAAALESALRAINADPEFANARVVALGSQVLVIPGVAGPVRVAPAADDARSVAELRLTGVQRVRVRVNGAESVDDRPLDVTA